MTTPTATTTATPTPQKPVKDFKKSKFNPAVASKIIMALKVGDDIKTAAMLAGITLPTLQKWMGWGSSGYGRYGRFVYECNKAQAMAISRNVSIVQRIASSGADDNVRLKAATWSLERMAPDVWGKMERREISGPNGSPIQISIESIKDLWIVKGGWTEEEMSIYADSGVIPEGKTVPRLVGVDEQD